MSDATWRILVAATAIFAVFCGVDPIRYRDWQAQSLPLAWLVVTMDFLMLLLCGGMAWWIRHRRRTRTAVHIGSAIVVACCTANAVLSAVVLSSILELVYVPLLAVCVGAVVLSRIYVWLACGLALAVVISTSYIISDSDGILWAGVTCLAGVLCSTTVFEGRMVANARILALRKNSHEKQEALEQALVRVEQELSDRVQAEERSDLAEAQREALVEQLQRAQKLDALGTLAGGVAHDMNNVLAAIRGVAEAASDELAPDSDLHADLRHILSAADRGAALTRNLLGFARQGKRRSEPFNGAQMVRDVVAILQRTAPKRVRLQVSVDHDSEHATSSIGDADQLSHALMNLCLNAIDSTQGHSEILISVSTVRLTGGEVADLAKGRYLQIGVRDTGCGMDDELRARVFDPFFSTKGGGHSGLGLSMVYGTVVDHKGHIEIDSAPGVGTTVTLRIPASNKVAFVPKKRRDRLPSHIELPILIIDDESLVRRSLARLLKNQGLRSEEADSGQAGLDALAKQRYAAVVLDLSMPQMDGTECLRLLRQVDTQTPVILASGYPKGQDVDALLLEGANGFIGKPYSAATLMSVLLAAIEDATRDAALR